MREILVPKLRRRDGLDHIPLTEYLTVLVPKNESVSFSLTTYNEKSI